MAFEIDWTEFLRKRLEENTTNHSVSTGRPSHFTLEYCNQKPCDAVLRKNLREIRESAPSTSMRDADVCSPFSDPFSPEKASGLLIQNKWRRRSYGAFRKHYTSFGHNLLPPHYRITGAKKPCCPLLFVNEVRAEVPIQAVSDYA